jgi:hypothetical protein
VITVVVVTEEFELVRFTEKVSLPSLKPSVKVAMEKLSRGVLADRSVPLVLVATSEIAPEAASIVTELNVIPVAARRLDSTKDSKSKPSVADEPKVSNVRVMLLPAPSPAPSRSTEYVPAFMPSLTVAGPARPIERGSSSPMAVVRERV